MMKAYDAEGIEYQLDLTRLSDRELLDWVALDDDEAREIANELRLRGFRRIEGTWQNLAG